MEKISFPFALILAFLHLGSFAQEQENSHNTTELLKVEVFTSEIQYTMQAGLGASWHAIEDIYPLNNERYKYPVRENNPLGSAWGGNPPVSDTSAWRQIKNHTSWLGLNFLRVELTHQMYEPQRGQFDWDNEEMQSLYQILDWCQENEADVFLQQMSGHVEWNSIPGVHPLISAFLQKF